MANRPIVTVTGTVLGLSSRRGKKDPSKTFHNADIYNEGSLVTVSFMEGLPDTVVQGKATSLRCEVGVYNNAPQFTAVQ